MLIFLSILIVKYHLVEQRSVSRCLVFASCSLRILSCRIVIIKYIRVGNLRYYQGDMLAVYFFYYASCDHITTIRIFVLQLELCALSFATLISQDLSNIETVSSQVVSGQWKWVTLHYILKNIQQHQGIFHNDCMSALDMRWQMVNDACSADIALIISYPTSEWNNYFIFFNAPKIQKTELK